MRKTRDEVIPVVHPSTLGPNALREALATDAERQSTRAIIRATAEKKRRKDTEHQAQSLLFAHIDLMPQLHPLRLAYAIPNAFAIGASTGRESKKLSVIANAKQKREGKRKGMLDICVPVARGMLGGAPFHALYLELKIAPKMPTEEQIAWAFDLAAQNNRVVIVRARDAYNLKERAMLLALSYLGSDPWPHSFLEHIWYRDEFGDNINPTFYDFR